MLTNRSDGEKDFVLRADEKLTAFVNYRPRFIVDLRLRWKVMRSSTFC